MGAAFALAAMYTDWTAIALLLLTAAPLLAVVAMGLLYDLPFKNLLLPPNGDQ